jgi:hypothetical protein
MIFGQLTAIGLWNLAKYLVVITFFSLWFEILTWFLACEFKEAWGYRFKTIVCYSYPITEGIKKGWNICEPP